MHTPRVVALFLVAVLVQASLSTSTHAQCLSTVFLEEFEGGVLPAGWVPTGNWIVESTQTGNCVTCSVGFAVSTQSPAGSCNCGKPFTPCSGSRLQSPAIALPTLATGQKLILDFCVSSHLDGWCNNSIQSCNRVEIKSSTSVSAFALGSYVFSACPGPFDAPPYDISAFAGQVVTLEWALGCIDPEGYMSFGIDTVRISHTLIAGPDCNGNLMPDSCDLQAGISADCNANLVPDECDIGVGTSEDCNANGAPDECDIAGGLELDCDGDGVPDACAIGSGAIPDCNDNGVPDSCDLAQSVSNDFDGNGVPDECQCTNTHFYCVGGVNSTGKTAKIGFQGPTSITQNHLALTVQDGRPNQIGIYFMGSFKTQTPFGDGFLCLTGNIERLMPPVFMDSTGAGSYVVDFTDPNSPMSNVQPLSEWNLQFWYRDPQVVGNNFNLSNALHAHFCP